MKKKRVTVYKMPKAQEGMEMAPPQEGQPQQGGGDQMQQLAQQVQQMLQQGAAPEQVVAQLLQGGVPPEAIMQVMVGLGMPQEQVQPLIEGVMQQMQGGPQGQPQEAPPQEGAQEGQPMMEDGGGVQPAKNDEPWVKNSETGYWERTDPKTGKIMVTAAPTAWEIGYSNAHNPYGIPLPPKEYFDRIQAGNPHISDYYTYPDGVNPIKPLGAKREYPRRKMQGGGEAEQQEQIMQLIQMFAQISGVDPEQIMQQLQSAEPEQQQAMVQEMAQTVQQAQGAGAQGQPQQPMMFHGGVTNSQPGSFISPNKADLKTVKKAMMKSLKGGGQTDAFDTTSSEAYVQNLHGAISNHIAKNHKMGLVNKRYEESMGLFNELPQAELGTEISRQQIIDEYGLSQDYVGGMDEAAWTKMNELYRQDKGIADPNANVTNENDNNPQTIPVGTQYGNNVWDGTKWVPIQGGYGQPQHYYPGYGPGMPQGGYAQQSWLTTPMGQMASAFGPRGSGGYRTRGIGGFEGMNPQDIQARMAQLAGDKNYEFNVEDVTRKRFLGLGKDKVIGKRMTWTPIGEQTGAGATGSQGGTGATATMAQVTDEDGTVRTMSLDEAERKGLAHKQIEVPAMQIGMQDHPGTGGNLAWNPNTGREEYTDERTAERWNRKKHRRQDRLFHEEPRGGSNVDYKSFSNEELQSLNDKQSRKLLGRRRKAGMMQHGGVTPSHPGGLIWDFDKMRFVKLPQAEEGLEMIGKRSFDTALFTEGLVNGAHNVNQFLTAARQNAPSWEATDQRSTDNTQPIFDIGSGGRGFYDQEGRFIPDDMGAKVMPGTVTDQDVYSSFNAKNFQGDFIPGQGMRYGSGYFQGGGLVGDVSFTDEELAELAQLGYNITRR
jgi:hypothetical protein